MPRLDREDLAPQRDAVKAARAGLGDALAAVVQAAKNARTGRGDLVDVYAATTRVRVAEEALDHAERDLATAGGADG